MKRQGQKKKLNGVEETRNAWGKEKDNKKKNNLNGVEETRDGKWKGKDRGRKQVEWS